MDIGLTADQVKGVGLVAGLLIPPDLDGLDGDLYLGEGSVIRVMDSDWVVGRFVIEDGFWQFKVGEGDE